MIENVMHNVGGVWVFGVFSICLFFAFFTGMFLWAIRLKRNYLDTMRGLPLDEEVQFAESCSTKTARQSGDITTSQNHYL